MDPHCDALDEALLAAYGDRELFGPAFQDSLLDAIRAERTAARTAARAAPKAAPQARVQGASTRFQAASERLKQARPEPGWWALVPVAAAALLLLWLSRGAPEVGVTPAPPRSLASIQDAGLEVKRAGRWQSLRLGDRVTEDEPIQNLARHPARLRLENGHAVTLRADSTVTLRRAPDGAREVDLRDGAGGEVLCEVTPGHGPFRVQAHGLTVTVLGTRFLVRSYEGQTRVVVLEGKVRCERDGEVVLLTRAQELDLDADAPFKAQPADLSERSRWLAPPEPIRAADIAREASAPERPASPEREPALDPRRPGETERGPFDLPVEPPERPRGPGEK